MTAYSMGVAPATAALLFPPVILRPPRLTITPATAPATGQARLRRGIYTAVELSALESEFLTFAGLVRIGTPSVVRLWNGIGDLVTVNSAFDPDASVWMGAARLIDMPTFQALWNGLAERITVTLTGVTDDMRSLVYDEAADVRGAVVRLGIAILDNDWQQIGPVRWLRRGRCDVLETDNRPGERERIKTISLSLGSQLTGRRVPGSGAYTNADQQARPGSSTDRFCERTPLMTGNLVIKWPA
jgi:hypothetical protein